MLRDFLKQVSFQSVSRVIWSVFKVVAMVARAKEMIMQQLLN